MALLKALRARVRSRTQSRRAALRFSATQRSRRRAHRATPCLGTRRASASPSLPGDDLAELQLSPLIS
jgi:hypothetical protein